MYTILGPAQFHAIVINILKVNVEFHAALDSKLEKLIYNFYITLGE